MFHALLPILVSFLAAISFSVETAQGMGALVWLALVVPTIAVGVRRLHDSGFSGWWILMGIVPVASLVLLGFLAAPSTLGVNKYGDSTH